MALESLATPLGQRMSQKEASRFPARSRVLLALLCTVGAFTLTAAGIRASRQQGDPLQVAVIERVPMTVKTNPLRTEQDSDGEGRDLPRTRSDAREIEEASGVRVVRQKGGEAPSATVIRVPDTNTKDRARLNLAPDMRVGEKTHQGILPRIGDRDLLPRRHYARPFEPTNMPKVGIVLTGVGIGARGTAEAITRLSGAVTLAFAPYGRDLESQVARARRDGHEVLLQVPMEPFDYPDSDPGPHTLRTKSTDKENIERLHWLMTRFSGYVGLVNFMGGKLISTQPAFTPILEDINRRGLFFLDDGTTPKAVTPTVAGRLGMPVWQADRILEGSGNGPSLESLLGEIEMIAKKKGSAVLMVPALPTHIATLAAWENELSQRGLVLAPISAIIGQKYP